MIDQEYGIQEKTIKAIGEFTINWNLFEHYYFGDYVRKNEIENLQIDDVNVNLELKSLRIAIQTYYHETTFNECMVKEAFFTKQSGPSTKDLQAMESFLNGAENVTGGILCIQRIRNNMFHGPKRVYLLNQQVEIIQAASNMLGRFTATSVIQKRRKRENRLEYGEIQSTI